jgi:hypothetical protein
MTGSTYRCTATPAGTATTPATSPVPATQQITMAMVCRGVIPTALKMPRSWTRSRVCSTTVLSTPRPATTASPGLDRLRPLIDGVAAAGLPAGLTVSGRPRALPPGLDLAAYRVVQEALTNVMKHAGRARTAVRLDYRPDELIIDVSDDGPPAAAPARGPMRAPGESAPARDAFGQANLGGGAACWACASACPCTAARSTPGRGRPAAGG